jgi:hypothetical protein
MAADALRPRQVGMLSAAGLAAAAPQALTRDQRLAVCSRKALGGEAPTRPSMTRARAPRQAAATARRLADANPPAKGAEKQPPPAAKVGPVFSRAIGALCCTPGGITVLTNQPRPRPSPSQSPRAEAS